MSRRALARTTRDDSGIVVWGWFAVVGITDGKLLNGGDAPGGEAAEAVKQALALRSDTTQGAWWCAWWTENPRRAPETPPDDFGVVIGPLAHAEAIGEADRVIRIARGRPCFAVSVGEAFARRAYREGARRKTSSAEAMRKNAVAILERFGLTVEKATIPAVRRAFRKMVHQQKLHPDQGGDPSAFNDLVHEKKAAEDLVRLIEQERAAGAYARGESVPVKPPKRQRKKAGPPPATMEA